MVPPVEPIKLGKPAAVVEKRAVSTPAPVPEAAAAAAVPEKEAEPTPTQAAEALEKVTEEVALVEEAAVQEEAVVPMAAAPIPDREIVKAYTGQKISLDLQEVDIRNVLRLLADITSKNIRNNKPI